MYVKKILIENSVVKTLINLVLDYKEVLEEKDKQELLENMMKYE